MMPRILSQFVSTIKEKPWNVINVPELTFAANQINNQLLTKPFEVFFILAIVYYVVAGLYLTQRLFWSDALRASALVYPAGHYPRLQTQALTAEP